METVFLVLSYIGFGMIIGSFLNVCIYRIPIGISINDGFSMCPSCHNRIMWYDLIPVLSFLILGGKCRYCKLPISPVYPFVELLNGILWLLAYLALGANIYSLLICLMLSALLVITFIDFKHMIIPDSLILFIGVLAVINLAIISHGAITDYIIGFFIVSVPFLIVAVLTGGMGGGDIKLMAVCGLLLGYKLTLLSLVLGSIAGTFYCLFLLLKDKAKLKTAVPFGPFLAVGLMLASLYGSRIITWYLSNFLGL